MKDKDYVDYLDDYLVPPTEPNLEMLRVKIVWERGERQFGARHIWVKHGISEREVEEDLFEAPPHVEARRHPDHLNRTIFWGATRYDR